MRFNEHYKLQGAHAFLSASNYHWVNYTDEKLVSRYNRFRAAARGSALHAFAEQAISLGIKLRGTTQTLTAYVNDAISFRMKTEQVLYYSENAFGTVDAISFRNNLLRIHDLKSGDTPASIMQLRVYAALFCLEYDRRPQDIEIELRIYQNDDVVVEVPIPEDIEYVMERIVIFDKIIREIRADEGEW